MYKFALMGLAVLSTALACAAAGEVRFEGNQKFTSADLARALSLSLEYQLVNAAAGAEERPPVISRLLTAGYRNEGFPDATVSAKADAQGDVLVTIAEGARFLCGELVVSGALQHVRVETLREELLPVATNAGAGCCPDQKSVPAFTNADARLWFWKPGLGVPYGAQTLTFARGAVSNVFARYGFFYPRFDVRLEQRPDTGRADLVVAIAAEGPAATIGEVAVAGADTNTADEIRAFLGLRAGDTITRPLLVAKKAQLMKTGRFIEVQLTAKPPQPDGSSQLLVQLLEAPGMPPLSEALIPAAEVLLRLAGWFEDWSNRDDEIVLSANLPRMDELFPPWDLQIIASGRRGVAVSVQAAADDGGAKLFSLLGLATGEKAIYLHGERRLYANPSSTGALGIELQINAHPPDAKGTWRDAGMKAHSGTGVPFSVTTAIHPAAIASLAYDTGLVCRLESGVLTIREADGMSLRVEAATGRPLGFSLMDKVTISPATGELDRAVAGLRSAGAGWPNLYASNKPIASLVSFAGPVLLHLQSLLFTNEASRLPPDQLVRAGAAVEKLLQAAVDLPWDSMWEGWSKGTNGMFIPLEASRLPPEVESGLMGMAAAMILADTDRLSPPGSWVSTLLRALAFKLSAQPRLIAGEMTRLGQSPQSGPLALRQCASTAAQLDLRFARNMATRALSRMSADDFVRDLGPMLDDRALLGSFLLRLAHTLETLDPGDVDALTALLPEEDAAPFRRFMKTLRSGQPADFRERLSAALAVWWTDYAAARFAENVRELRDRINERLVGIPPPGPCTALPAGIVDLGGVYNQGLRAVFGSTPAASNCMARLTTNVQHLAGHDFDVRGIVWTASPGSIEGVPSRIDGLVVGRVCKRLHFLHGVVSDRPLQNGQNVAEYTVRYQDGTRESIEVLAGQDIADVYAPADAAAPQARIAWEGEDTRGAPVPGRTRLYVQTWENPNPDRVIQTIDFICWHARAAPFLVALTAD